MSACTYSGARTHVRVCACVRATRQAEAEVLLLLLDVHPAAAHEVDENGMLPLHVTRHG